MKFPVRIYLQLLFLQKTVKSECWLLGKVGIKIFNYLFIIILRFIGGGGGFSIHIKHFFQSKMYIRFKNRGHYFFSSQVEGRKHEGLLSITKEVIGKYISR